MNLTTEQLQAAEKGVVKVEADGKRFVLMTEEVYERVKRVLCFDEMDPREAYPAVLKAWDMDGSPEDKELYKDYVRKP